jgi:hypothetical protein
VSKVLFFHPLLPPIQENMFVCCKRSAWHADHSVGAATTRPFPHFYLTFTAIVAHPIESQSLLMHTSNRLRGKKNGEPIPTEPLLEAVRRCSPTLRLGRPQRERCGGQAQPDIRTAQMSPNNRIATNTVIKIQLFRPTTLSRTAYSSRSHSTTDRTQIIGYLPQNKHTLRHSAKRRREKEADSPEALQYLRDELDQLNELRSEDVRDYMASELDEDMEDTFSDGNIFGDTAAVASADSEKEVATKAFQFPTRWVPWRCASCRTFCASY